MLNSIAKVTADLGRELAPHPVSVEAIHLQAQGFGNGDEHRRRGVGIDLWRTLPLHLIYISLGAKKFEVVQFQHNNVTV